MDSGLKLREGEEVLLEQEIELVYEEEKKSCLQKLLGCCAKQKKAEGSSFIIITNQRVVKVIREMSEQGSDSSEHVSYTFIPPKAIVEYGYNYGSSKGKAGLCCCKSDVSSGAGTFYLQTAANIYTLGAESIDVLDAVSEALYKLINQ